MGQFTIADPPHVPDDVADDVLPITHDDSDFRTGARLVNFPTGKSSIRSSQAAWVKDNVEPLFRTLKDCTIDLIGHASPLGSSASNQVLSHNRIDAIQALLESRAAAGKANVFFRKADAKGEDEAAAFGQKEGSNSGAFRAVEVQVFGDRPPVVIRPGRLKSLGTDKFKIRTVLSVAAGLPSKVADAVAKTLPAAKLGKAGIPVTADVVFFEIVEDKPGGLGATFVYIGAGFGISFSFPKTPRKAPGISAGLAGGFRPFRTTRRVFLPTFDGEASVGQPPNITIGPASTPTGKGLTSVVQLTMESANLVQSKALVVPRNLVVPTGAGFAITVFSVTKGTLIMASTPTPFTGP